MNHSITRTI